MSLLVTFTNAGTVKANKEMGGEYFTPRLEINVDKIVKITEFKDKAQISVSTGSGLKSYTVDEDLETVKLRIEEAEIERATRIARVIGTPPAR